MRFDPRATTPTPEQVHRLASAAGTLPAPLVELLRRLRQAGHEAWLAGGCVRDTLLGRPFDDFDVATSATPLQVQALFERVVPTGLAHGTVTVLLDDSATGPHDKVEVTTFRGEGAYLDGRRPSEIRFLSSVDEDLARRDFSVNALAWDPLDGELRDPFDGTGDLERRLLRAVGSAQQRFEEDGLRPLRGVRLASVLQFQLEPETLAAVGRTLHVFRRVASERVRDELIKLLVRSPRPSEGLRLLLQTGLLQETLPELLAAVGQAQNRYHRWDVWEHTLQVLDHSEPRLVARLAALLHDVAKPRCAQRQPTGEYSFHRHEVVGAELSREILERLRFPRVVCEAVAHQVRQHNWHYTSDWSDAAVRRRLAELGVDALEEFFALRVADIRGHGVGEEASLAGLSELRRRFELEQARKSALSVAELAIGGREVLAVMGGAPGPRVGELLRAALAHVIEHPEENTAEALQRWLAQQLRA